MRNFNDLKLHETLVQNLTSLGYETPTSIQTEAIPFILEGHDILGIAQTGTGKTAAFSLPVLNKILTNSEESRIKNPVALILAPTRELCSQIQTSIEAYSKNTKIKSIAIYGGVGQGEQVRGLKDGAQIIVATPGRLLDLLEQKHLNLTHVSTFVLDEADRMLDMGFIDDIKDIIGRLPSKKQTLLFSATIPDAILALASKILKNHKTVEVAPSMSVTENINQKIIFCKRPDKFQLLKKILKEESSGLVLVFTRTKNLADSVVEYLAQNRMASRALHGDKDQKDRERALSHFSDGSIRILIATDIASRGIDVLNIEKVINFDLPIDPESYVHRIGRTARAGKSGEAISFCEESEKPMLAKMEEILNIKLKTEKFVGKPEVLKLKATGVRKVTPPTPGRSQEKTAYLDHSKRQAHLSSEQKKAHPGFKKKSKKRK